MAYLDLSPMMTALRSRPDEFELVRGRVNHIPSRHSFGLDPHGNATVHAQCNCAWLSVSREQSREMAIAIDNWKDTYWRAVANVLAERDATPLPVAAAAPAPRRHARGIEAEGELAAG